MTLDSFIYGFTMQQVEWPSSPEQTPASAADFVARTPAREFPHMVEMADLVARGGLDPGAEFERGLALILDGLEGRLADSAG